MSRKDRQRVLRASTAEELEKSFEEVSVLDLLVIGRKIGVDVDGISKKHLRAEQAELENAIRKILLK